MNSPAVSRELSDTRRQARRLGEQITVVRQDIAWTAARLWRLHGTPLPMAAARQRQRCIVERNAIILPHLAAAVARWIRQVEDDVRRLHLRVSWAATPGTNAYAFPTVQEIEVAPIVSPEGFAQVAHEIAHHARPCQPDHRRVSAGCVRCEIAAWQYVQLHAVDWWREMHDEMARCLATYRPYGTPAEQREIDARCAPMGFRLVQQQRATQRIPS